MHMTYIQYVLLCVQVCCVSSEDSTNLQCSDAREASDEVTYAALLFCCVTQVTFAGSFGATSVVAVFHYTLTTDRSHYLCF